MKQLRQIIAAGFAATMLAACTAGQTVGPTATTANIAANAVQFAVGTANIQGTSTGMNVVVTARQPNGLSAVLVSQPVLTGEFTLPAGTTTANSAGATISTGPSTGEVSGAICGAPCITGTPQQTPGTPVASYPYLSTFGTAGGAFGMGFAPDNAPSPSSPTSNTFTPYAVPVYGTAIFTPWGGTPAYDPNRDGKGTRDGTFADITRGILGVQEGINVFKGVTANAGAYNLTLNIPTTGATNVLTAPTFTLGAPTLLPTITAPTIAFDGTGQATISYVLPAGITGAYIQVRAFGSQLCNASGNINLYGPATTGNTGAGAPGQTIYTFWVTSSGSVTVTNAMSPGPAGSAFPAVCTQAQNRASPLATGTETGDTVRAWVVGFDYNHYAITYNGPLGSTYPQKPALPASADISISPTATAISP